MDSKHLTIHIGSFIATSDERDDDDDDDADDDDADDGKWTSITLTGTSSVIKKKWMLSFNVPVNWYRNLGDNEIIRTYVLQAQQNLFFSIWLFKNDIVCNEKKK